MFELNQFLSRSAEDYLRAVYELVEKKKYARITDIAKQLKVKPPSVTEMIKKLREEGLVDFEKYSAVTLTLEGEKLAKKIMKRNKLLLEFLAMIGVDDKTAKIDAHKIEHDLSLKTIERLLRLVNFIQEASHDPKWLKLIDDCWEKLEELECDRRKECISQILSCVALILQEKG